MQVIAGWRGRLTSWGRISILSAAAVSPVASHVALLTGQGFGVAVPLGALQAVAAGIVLVGIGGTGRHRRLAVLTSTGMLVILGFGLIRSPAFGLRLAAGTSHALLYGALFVVFAATLLPGRTALVTRIALRLNQRFHDGMRSYTRHATVAWCVFFAGQLVLSALLARFAPDGWWFLFVNGLHLPLVLLMFMGEYVIRRRVFPGSQSTDIVTMIRSARRSGAAARASIPPDRGR